MSTADNRVSAVEQGSEWWNQCLPLKVERGSGVAGTIYIAKDWFIKL